MTAIAHEFDTQRSERFAEELLGMMNQAGLTLMISVGHRTRLFDTMAELPASTSLEIAAAAGLNERYVREWLGAMTTGGIVEHDSELSTYSLPAEHAAFLTRAASPNNVATSMQFIAVLGAVESRIVECFERGGGVKYEEYPRFHEVMAEESSQTVLGALEAHILPLVPGLTDRLEQGIEVLDIGCGSGRAMIQLARQYPNSRFHGYDFCDDAVAAARAEAAHQGVTNVRFEQRDVSALTDTERFDLITAFDAIHDQAKPDRVLEAIARAVKPDGLFLMQDLGCGTGHHRNLNHPLGPFVYTISCMHCMSVSLEQGGMGLGAAWGREKALEMLAAAGFGNVSVHDLPHDVMNAYYLARVG